VSGVVFIDTRVSDIEPLIVGFAAGVRVVVQIA
jgi:hypothetical protein